MKKVDVKPGSVYLCKVSGRVSKVLILKTSVYGGWDAKNLATGRVIRIRGAQRLRKQLPPIDPRYPGCGVTLDNKMRAAGEHDE